MTDDEPAINLADVIEAEDTPIPGLLPERIQATMDHERPPMNAEYVDWTPEDTKVVSGPIGPAKKFPGQRFRSRGEARRHWLARAGRIIKDLSIPGRWIFRVRRDA